MRWTAAAQRTKKGIHDGEEEQWKNVAGVRICNVSGRLQIPATCKRSLSCFSKCRSLALPLSSLWPHPLHTYIPTSMHAYIHTPQQPWEALSDSQLTQLLTSISGWDCAPHQGGGHQFTPAQHPLPLTLISCQVWTRTRKYIPLERVCVCLSVYVSTTFPQLSTH